MSGDNVQIDNLRKELSAINGFTKINDSTRNFITIVLLFVLFIGVIHLYGIVSARLDLEFTERGFIKFIYEFKHIIGVIFFVYFLSLLHMCRQDVDKRKMVRFLLMVDKRLSELEQKNLAKEVNA